MERRVLFWGSLLNGGNRSPLDCLQTQTLHARTNFLLSPLICCPSLLEPEVGRGFHFALVNSRVVFNCPHIVFIILLFHAVPHNYKKYQTSLDRSLGIMTYTQSSRNSKTVVLTVKVLNHYTKYFTQKRIQHEVVDMPSTSYTFEI